ncbi:hypothetical protein [Bacillus sp. JKS001846]|uniref:hypothetical protein n=1 Tax=Bacillus sp. JKS001846 TaxID=1938743 RepID=UPI0009D7E214|nr:hypothetical protein [Bacillus sp. JKS001846]SMD41315.1 hypothetical protein SAMN06272738_6038 [Bacillus sp. JKS001846]
MAQTFRLYLPKQKTGWHAFNWDIMREKMPSFPVVHISACEARLYDNSLGTDLQTIELVQGDASIYATSVVPSINSDGTTLVDFLLVVDWDHETKCCL